MNTFRLLGTALVLSLSFSLSAQKELTNLDIWYSPTFSTESVGGLASMKDGLHYTAIEEENGIPAIVQFTYKDGKKKATIVSATELVPAGADGPLEIEGYSFSGDEKKMMIETDVESIYRYSYSAYHYVFDRSTKKVVPLSDVTKSKQRLATFSPDGSRAAFVRDNNLFVVDLSTMEERAVTTDGEWNKVLYGATDWVYEEEFALVQGYAWSPGGTKLLYLRSDESKVKEWDLTYYRGELYPDEYRFKYPKAGEVNSEVSLHVYEVATQMNLDVPLGDRMEETYLPRFGWTTKDDVLWFMWMGRLQNEKLIYTVNIPSQRAPQYGLKATRIYEEKSNTYVEVTDDLHFLEDGSGFVLTSERSGWNHIYRCPMDGGEPQAITSGEYDVLAVQGVDERMKRVIFTASQQGPTVQEVFAVSLSGGKPAQLSPEGGVNEPEFSTGFRYFINTHSTANEPPVVALYDGSGKLVKTLKDNTRLRANLAPYALRPVEFMTITTGAGIKLDAWLITPPGFDKGRKYPVLMTQYSGPNSKEVLNEWGGRNALWFQMLAQKGYIVVSVDPRGTGRHGKDFRHITYGQLGKYETEDQIGAAVWLGQQPYVDRDRIGIWGWSYGGYMSSLCITKGASVFKAAIAVAPVTNWRYYDSIYTERYMGLPKDNGEGYDDNSPINHVSDLKGNYLLVHGTADDNVHYQNSAEMVNALVRANKQFDQFAYPDRNHGIYGGTTRLHLFDLMTDWVLENL